jgi:hypothetical protein
MGDLNLLDSNRVPARINSTDWKNPAPTIKIAELRVRQALSVLISNQSDIWDMGAQIQRFEEL